MKHIKAVSQSAPASASILSWWPQLTAAMTTTTNVLGKVTFTGYVDLLFGQDDGRTADPSDGDIGNDAVL